MAQTLMATPKKANHPEISTASDLKFMLPRARNIERRALISVKQAHRNRQKTQPSISCNDFGHGPRVGTPECKNALELGFV
mgnify:FL=1